MIYDAHLELCNAQGAITSSQASEEVINMGGSYDGEDPKGFLEFVIDTAGTGTGTVTFKVQDCDTEAGTYSDIASSASIVGTDLVKGKRIKVPIPGTHKKYLRGYFTVSGTVGAVIVSGHIATN